MSVIVNAYVTAVRKTGSPVVAYVDPVKSGLASRPSVELMLAYSIIPITSAGTLASADNEVAYVSMPHVLARGDAGEATQRAIKAAGFGAAGFAGTQALPKTTAERAASAGLLLAKLLKVWTPPTPEEAPAEVAPAEAAPVPEAPKAKPPLPSGVRQQPSALRKRAR